MSFANNPSQDGNTAAFVGFGSGNFTGLYVYAHGSLVKIADSNTAVPAGVGNFSDFSSQGGFPSPEGNKVAFYAFGTGQVRGMTENGVYLSKNGSLTKIADQNSLIPGGSGQFLNMAQASLDGGRVAFIGHGDGQQGIYVFSGDTLKKVVDLNTPQPNGGGNFSNLTLAQLRNGVVAFVGFGPTQQGIYTATLAGAVSVVADLNTHIPGGTGNFTALNDVSTSGGKVAFRGMGSVDDGVYSNAGGSIRLVANTMTRVPGEAGDFLGFGSEISFDCDHTAFLGFDAAGPGIYTNATGSLTKVIGRGDMLDGRMVQDVAFSAGSLSGNNLDFRASFKDGAEGVFDARFAPAAVPEPSSFILALSAGGLIFLRSRYRVWTTRWKRNFRPPNGPTNRAGLTRISAGW
jgi:hypothetical protein